LIYEESVRSGVIPSDFKRTNVTPIFKSGKKTNPSNYRPINLCSVPAKVMESIIKYELIPHLMDNELILPSQHGFLPGKSCSTNLLAYMNEVTASLDKGVPFDVIMIDFQKAFDTVPFKHMLKKLKAHGVLGDVYKWIENWTKDRKQRVVLNGVCSEWTDVLSSVVQGSVLGPVLFIIYINDIDLVITDPHTNMFKYADDSKFGRPVRTSADALTLQAQINHIWQWAERWGMTIHPMKTVVIHFGYGNPKHQYNMNGCKISDVSNARDLGIIVDESCSPSLHVQKIAKKANGVLSQLSRTLIS